MERPQGKETSLDQEAAERGGGKGNQGAVLRLEGDHV